MRENPYESSQLEAPKRSWKRSMLAPAFVAVVIALAMLTGAILWSNSNRWIPVFFAAPVVAICIAATQFGSVPVWKSLRSVLLFVAVSVAGYVAFFTTCCGVNLGSIDWGYHVTLDPERAAAVTTITTLLGCFVAFLLSKRYLRAEK